MSREGKAKVLKPGEFKHVVAVANTKPHAERNNALLYMSFGLGLRVKELASLKIKDIIGPDGDLLEEINLTKDMTKGGKQRHAYLTNKKVRDALTHYLNKRMDDTLFNPEAVLFRSQKGKFSPNSLQKLFHRIYKQAGLYGCSSHSGRRTFATRLIENGCDIKAVSRLMGHASVAMTARYVEDNPER
jgi:integrase/recombinase XerD